MKIRRYKKKTFKTTEQKIIERSKLKNLFNKNNNQENWYKYKIQQNHCVNLLYKTRKQY